MKTYFQLVQVNAKFFCNGNEYIKKSSRTAELLTYSNKTFYFRKNDLITVFSRNDSVEV